MTTNVLFAPGTAGRPQVSTGGRAMAVTAATAATAALAGGGPAFDRATMVRRLSAAAIGLFDTLLEWQERERQRRHLMALDDRLLRDMGIGRADVEFEASKPFWKV